MYNFVEISNYKNLYYSIIKSGVIAVLVGISDKIDDAFNHTVIGANNIIFKDKLYRKSIGSNVTKWYTQMKERKLFNTIMSYL